MDNQKLSLFGMVRAEAQCLKQDGVCLAAFRTGAVWKSLYIVHLWYTDVSRVDVMFPRSCRGACTCRCDGGERFSNEAGGKVPRVVFTLELLPSLAHCL